MNILVTMDVQADIYLDHVLDELSGEDEAELMRELISRVGDVRDVMDAVLDEYDITDVLDEIDQDEIIEYCKARR